MLSVSVVALCATYVARHAITTLSRARENRLRGDSADAIQRLERIEAAVDAVAIEVERISEAQRFAVRLQAGIADSSPPARAIAPH